MKKGMCRDCASAEREEAQGDDAYSCHLDPPRENSVFPRVSGGNWCRQFEPTTPKTPTPFPEKITRPASPIATRKKANKGR